MSIIFRRVHGRVIPIMTKEGREDAKNLSKGAGKAVAGVGIAGAAGLASAQLDLRSHALSSAAKSFEFRAAKLHSLGNFRLHAKRMAQSETFFLRASRNAALSSTALRYGSIAGVALVGAGLHKMLSGTPLKKREDLRAGVSASATVGVSKVMHSLYKSKFYSDVNLGGAIKSSLRTALRGLKTFL